MRSTTRPSRHLSAWVVQLASAAIMACSGHANTADATVAATPPKSLVFVDTSSTWVVTRDSSGVSDKVIVGVWLASEDRSALLHPVCVNGWDPLMNVVSTAQSLGDGETRGAWKVDSGPGHETSFRIAGTLAMWTPDAALLQGLRSGAKLRVEIGGHQLEFPISRFGNVETVLKCFSTLK